jgi:hypothetical protein
MRMTADTWPETLEKLKRLVAEKGVRNLTHVIPVSGMTIYRLINGEVRRPIPAVEKAIREAINGQNGIPGDTGRAGRDDDPSRPHFC